MSAMRKSRSALSATLLLGISQSAALAGPVEASYSITLAGLTIGRASLSGQISAGSYRLNASASLTGLVGAIAKGSGSGTASGSLGGAMPLSNGFVVTASNGKVTRTIQLPASSGNFRPAVIDPPLENFSLEGRVPLRDGHRQGVLDPLSALVMPVRGTDPFDKANCNRKLPVFDGTQRFDIQLSFSGIRNVRSEAGYAGPVLVCSARYIAVSGHRPDRKAVQFMTNNRDIDTWLVPVNGGTMLIPWRISVKTMIGTSVLEAQRFSGAEK